MNLSLEVISGWLSGRGIATRGEKRTREIAAATLLFIGGGIGLASTYVAGLPATYDVSWVRVVASITLALSAAEFWVGHRWPRWRHQILEGAGTLLIGAAIYGTGGGDVSVAAAMASFLVVLDATLFLSKTAMLAHIVLLICVNVTALNLVPGVSAASIFFVASVLAGAALVSFRLIHARDAVEVDFLTGLVNQRGFERMLDERLARTSTSAGVALLHLHATGAVRHEQAHGLDDEELHELAQHWQALLPAHSIFAHFGGGRFAIYWDEESVGESEQSAQRFVEQPGEGVSCFAGLALAEPGDDVSILSSRATAALQLARRRGAGHCARHPGSYNGDVQIRAAVAAGQFVLQYQPIIRLGDGVAIGAEALIRWRHPKRGLLGPGRFIADTELTGSIIQLGQWVMSEACRQAARWPRAGGSLPYVSVNASARELREIGYADRVIRVLESSGLGADRLVLEFVETDYDDGAPTLVENLARLRKIGVRIAIDDFGTGHSNFARLSRQDVDILKVDKSLVGHVDDDEKAASVGTAIFAMSRVLGLATIAEGVETREQATWLRMQGCHAAQGYLYSSAVEADLIGQVLARAPAGDDAATVARLVQ